MELKTMLTTVNHDGIVVVLATQKLLNTKLVTTTTMFVPLIS